MDTYSLTVGLSEDSSALKATCSEPAGIGTALDEAHQFGEQDVIVAVESLTPFYSLNRSNFSGFVQTTFLRYAGGSRRVVTMIDEEFWPKTQAISPELAHTFVLTDK